jgi:hypothetical protein
MRLLRLSLFREKLNFNDNRDYREAIIAISRFTLSLERLSHLLPTPLSSALCPLYGPLSPVRPSVPSTTLYLSTTLCTLYCPMSPLRPSALSTTLCPLYGPLSPLRFLSPLQPLSSLQPSAPSTSLSFLNSPLLLYGTICPLQPLVSSTVLSPLHSPLSSLRPSVS